MRNYLPLFFNLKAFVKKVKTMPIIPAAENPTGQFGCPQQGQTEVAEINPVKANH